MNVSAARILAFLLICFFTIIVFSVVAEKIVGDADEVCLKLGDSDICLKFFTVNEMLGFEKFKSANTPEVQVAVKPEIVSDEKNDDNKIADLPIDSAGVLAAVADSDSSRFWLPGNNRNYWNEIFEHWESLRENKELYRIVHYGDSQIEMDRMTAYIRRKLQARFGGSGPGLLPPMQIIPSYTIKQSASETWNRFICYGLAENKAYHRNYGVSGMIFSFDSGYAHVSISSRIKNDSLLNRFENVKIITGRTGKSFQVALSAKANKFQTRVVPVGEEQLTEWKLQGNPSVINLTFTGDTTAEVLGIAIDADYGIAMDNIPWRGSSGTTFNAISKTSLSNTYDLLNVKMVILQFGGNSVPYIKTEKALMQFVNGFKKQINYIRAIDSTIKILVIGPADMSYNNKGQFETYPLLESIIDSMRHAANNSGAAYWSLYHAMGGKNSMVRWVDAYPQLAAPDYIHFTPKGSELISQVFYNAIEREYEIYRKRKSKNAIP